MRCKTMKPTAPTARKPRAFTGWIHAYDLNCAKVPVHRALEWAKMLNGQTMAHRVRVTPLPPRKGGRK
jgi:hypothetical protein